MRLLALLLLMVGGVAHGAPPRAAPTGSGFRLEGKPRVDDVFGDAADYRRTVDRFITLANQMQAMRDQFAHSVQATLAALNGGTPRKRRCPSEAVARPYARAYRLGSDYLRIGRELTRHYEQVKEFDHLGESLGLTPDYRWKVKRVLQQYATLLTDYREMKVAFHDQLVDELKYVGCDLQALLLRGDPQVKPQGEDRWPQPGQPGAPGVQLVGNEAGPPERVPPNLPAERMPPQQPIPVPSRRPAPADPSAEPPRSGILFYVDNSRCQRGTTVYLDGKKLGEVPAATRVGFQTSAGPHDLCLLTATTKQCGAPGTVRRSYLHEGWTIALRCE